MTTQHLSGEGVKHSVGFEGAVIVTVNDPDVIERVTGPGGDEWRAQVYGGLHTANDVLRHLAWNHISGGVERANQLDGWADLPDDAATMEREWLDADGEIYTPEPTR